MASSAAHTSFPTRPYAGLGRPGSTAAQQQQSTYPPPASNPYPAYNAGGSNLGGAAGVGGTQQQRDAARLERDRQERAERERREAEERGALEALTEEQREEVNEAFGLFDLDKDAHVDYHELKVALKALGFDLPKADILGLLQAHGVPASTVHPDPSGKTPATGVSGRPTFAGPGRLLLPQAAFVTIAARMIAARDPRDEILRAFALFDTEGKGSISLADLRRVARELGEGLQEEELQAMIEEFDMDGDGMISQEDFIGICLG